MGWIDLTYSLHAGMSVIPGDLPPEVNELQTVERDGCSVQEVSFTNHVGTHVDAPLHFLPGGRSVEDIPLSQLVGPASVLDFSQVEAGGRIGWAELESALSKLGNPRKIILYTGWGRYCGLPRYFEDFPVLTLEAAKGLARMDIDLVGMDTPSPSPLDDEEGIHKVLLKAGVVIVENLTKLDRLGAFAEIAVLPLPVRGASGAPCRAIGRPASWNC